MKRDPSKAVSPNSALEEASNSTTAGLHKAAKWLPLVLLAATLLLVLLVRARLLAFPLERDEGEYALMGQLLLKGIPPYELAYNMKLPGTYYMYALLMGIFGQSPTGIHLGLLLVNLGSILLVFLIGKRLLGESVAALAAASFALLSLSPGSLGLAAHATHFNAFFGLAGLWAMLVYKERNNWKTLLISGICFGLAFLMKQQSVFFLPFGIFAFWWVERQKATKEVKTWLPRLGSFALAMVLPYLCVLLSAWYSGTFDAFWHWTVEYARQYVGIKDAKEAWGFLKLYFPHVSEGYWLYWLTGLLGLVGLFLSEENRKHNKWLLLVFAGCGLASVLPGFYFRPHYFLVFFPALGLLVGMGLHVISEKTMRQYPSWRPWVPSILFVLLASWAIWSHREVFFVKPVGVLCGEMYGTANPFEASLEIGRFIQSNSTEKDKVAILGSEPQIYFYSKRLPATGYIYTYPLMENQPYSREMQRNMMAEIERAEPKFLLFVNSPLSWTKSENSPKDIFDWYGQYQKNYNMVGLVDLNPTGKPTYVWREALNNYTPKNKNQIWVYMRK